MSAGTLTVLHCPRPGQPHQAGVGGEVKHFRLIQISFDLQLYSLKELEGPVW